MTSVPYSFAWRADKGNRMAQSLTRRALLGLAAAGLSMASSRLAVAGMLAGRRIRFLIGNEGAGGYEAYARLFAKYLSLALPDAALRVETVPTADGRLAAKRIFEARRGDLVIGLFESALMYAEISGEPALAFELDRFNWLGKLAVDERVVVAGKSSGIKSIADLATRTEPAVYPASTIASRGAVECYILNALLDLPIKPVAGYDGGERALAIISGEAQVVVGSYSSSRGLVEDEGAVVILRLNEVANPMVSNSVPLLRDLAPKPVSSLVDLIELSATLGRWIAAPPDALQDDVAALRSAFDQVVRDKAFLAEAAERKIPIDAASGREVQDKIARLLRRKSELSKELSAAVACGKTLTESGAC
jgi:tripartite-type tricarboxylate transporter receptor subunit TctC